MKRLHINLLLTIFMSVVGLKAFAYDALIDGIWYEFHGDEAWVVNPNFDEEGTYWAGHGNYSSEVTIPSSVYYQGTSYKVTTIDDAFAYCSGLTSLKIPSSIKLITGGSTFEDCTQFSKVIINDIASWCNVELYYNYGDNPLYYAKHLYKYDGWQYVEVTDLVIPQNVSTIKHDVFSGGNSFSSITISGDVTSIGERAFYGCNNLTTVIVKNATPPTIKSSSFSNIGNTTLYVPHGSKAAYQAADYWKDFGTIVDVAIDDVFTAKTKEGVDMSFKVTSISPLEVQVGDGAKTVIDNTYAGSITIPSSVAITGTDYTFTVSQIGVNAFNGCNLITSVEIPLTIKTIEKRIFDGCKSLKEVVLPNSIKRIPANLNLKSTAIKNIHVTSSVTWIGLYAISECETVIIEDGNTDLELQDRNGGDGYYNGTLYGVKELYVGRNTDNHSTSDAGETFLLSGSSWNVLNNITFGPLVTKAFWGYDLRGCSNVTSVTCLGKEPFTSPDFYTIPQTAVLYVPLGSQQQYASADGWSQFGNITEVTEVTITMDDTEMVYAGDFDLDFSNVDGLKAYTAGDFDEATSTITLNPIQLVSAGKGVILKGAKGTYTVPCANIEPSTTDALCGTISGRFIRNIEGENVNYAFDKDEHVFKPVDAAYGSLISRNGAYLSLPASSVSGTGNITLQYKEVGTAVDDVFTAKTKEGVDMSFKVTSIDPLEVQVGEGDVSYFGAKAAIDKTYAGKITIPSTVTIPGTNKTFTVSKVGVNAFNGCNLMTSVEIPLTIKTIAERIFDGCKSLKEVVLPNSINTIPANLALKYSEGTAIEYIHVPSSVTWIGLYAISKCNTVVIEDGNSNLELENRNADDGYYDGTLYGVKKLYVGRNTDNHSTSYAGETFRLSGSSYTELNNITFGPLVTKAFWGYDLRGCSNVTSVTCLGKDPFTSPDFYTIPQTAVLYVPLGSQQQYASADGWSQFGNITEVTEVTITMDDTEMVYAGDFDLDFSHVDGLKAYTAGDYDMATSTIILNPIQLVSAGKGVILKGAKGTYTVPCANIEPTTTDALCGTISGRFIRNTEGENVNYAFDKDEHVFKPVDATYGSLISRNGAYLSLPASSVSGTGNITLQYKELKTIGDANGDGHLNVADAVSLVNYILQKPSDSFVLAAADVNGDNLINVADVVSIVKLILGQSSSARRRSAIQEATTNDRLTLACSDRMLTLNLENQTQFVAAQFDVHIPDGQKMEGISLADRTTELQLSYARIDNSAYRVLLYSLGNGVITGESGELLKMKLSDPVSEVIVDNIQFITDDLSIYRFDDLHASATGILSIKDSQNVDVYTIDGRLVKKQADNIDGLKKGIYIINNQKVIVK